jgi:Cu/Zn superoxide dismutase
MRKTFAYVAAVAAVGAAAACTPNGTGPASSTGHGNTNSGAASQSSSASSSSMPGTTAQGASNGMQGMGSGASADTASFVQPTSYSFRTVNDAADPTFNQLLGVNNDGVIAGYFGSGAQGHPNKGFRVAGGASSFVPENVPNSVQTQVTAINNRGVTVGFSSTMNNANQVNDNTGFVDLGGSFRPVAFPTAGNANPAVNQLLGVNDSDVAVGFYTDGAGNNHGYEYNIDRRSFHAVTVSGSTSSTAAGINDRGDVAGFFTNAAGATDGFLLTEDGKLTSLAYPGASMTQALGINDHREVVGVYQVGSGDNAQTHGFTWTARGGFKKVDDPNGVGATTVNGVNDEGVLVGFYTDANGNTDGMLATPGRPVTTEHLNLSAMPTGTVTVNRSAEGTLSAQVTVFGLTPGSAHTVEIVAPGHSAPVAVFSSPLTADATGRANATLTATGSISELPEGSKLVILLGQPSSDPANAALAAEPIAKSDQLPSHPYGFKSELAAVDVNTDGASAGELSGRATVSYDSAAQTITVTVSASGLTPGAHAAHIHAGSCQSQGGVLYMLMDFQADAHGNVVNQTRTVTGVQSMPASGTWYLNLHLGTSNNIVANGAPTLNFRPLLCANG